MSARSRSFLPSGKTILMVLGLLATMIAHRAHGQIACIQSIFGLRTDGGLCASPDNPKDPSLDWWATVDCFTTCGTFIRRTIVPLTTASGDCLGPTACNPELINRDERQLVFGQGLWLTSAFPKYATNQCIKGSEVTTRVWCECTTCGGDDDSFDQHGDDPLMFSLADDTLSLTSREGGVRFDLSSDGSREHTAWSAPGSDEAFLVLDRNANGTIDSGLEVSGDTTPQLPSDEPNGFRALQVFDDTLNGGNEDGWIDALDRIYFELQLWIDANHDGISQPEELSGLRSAGIEGIDLAYEKSTHQDAFGNSLRYFTQLRRSGEGAAVAWNVFFTQR